MTITSEKELLDTVIEVAGCDEKMIRKGIIKALQGINDKPRRDFLWRTLTKKAERKIRDAQRRAGIL